MKNSSVDARHEAVFGFAFYAISLLSELLASSSNDLAGRLILRSLVECSITLTFLLFKDDLVLWYKYRRFGSGQAKLALLKIEECLGRKPTFINENILKYIANEDLYQEYLTIELGHWCGMDLRKMSEVSATKDDYDKYYNLTSTYNHGHWSAIRDACFVTCLNPLHRLHRIPSSEIHKSMSNVAQDAVHLVNKIFSNVRKAYPGLTVDVEKIFTENICKEAISENV